VIFFQKNVRAFGYLSVLIWLLCALVTTALAGEIPAPIDPHLSWPEVIAQPIERVGGKKLSRVTRPERERYIWHATVWRAIDTAGLDLKGFPRFLKDELAAEEISQQFIECRYVKQHKVNGSNPKFKCQLPSGKKLKVKYHPKDKINPEVYTESFATKLLWALGFGADRVYLVKELLCHGCPENPFKGKGTEKDRVYQNVSIEFKLGKKIESKEDEGWNWAELKWYASSKTGLAKNEIKSHVDALRLLAAVLNHYDNKPENQRIVCPPGTRNQLGQCLAPHMIIQDVGTILGNPLPIALGVTDPLLPRAKTRLHLDSWQASPVWLDEFHCVAHLNAGLTGRDRNRFPGFVVNAGGLYHPTISERGRAFLAERLSQLSQQQIFDLFDSAGFTHPAEWTTVFLSKIAMIQKPRCHSFFPSPLPFFQ